MNISFEGKRILITGAGRGIGRDLVKAFIQCKAATVYALSRTKSTLDTLIAEVPANLGTVVPVEVDLCDWEATKKVLEKLGPVDVLVNNAAVFVGESFCNVKPESFDVQFSVNVKAVINVSQVIAKRMIEQKTGGCIVNISSQASRMALKEHIVYCATKAALDSITRVMALELGEHNIRVVAVGPTVVLTDMGRGSWSDPVKAKPMLDRIPLGRFAEVDECVNVVLFLASDKASMINGSMLPIDGGALAT